MPLELHRGAALATDQGVEAGLLRLRRGSDENRQRQRGSDGFQFHGRAAFTLSS